MSNTNTNSFDYAVNNFFINLLKTTNTYIVKYCQDHFDFKLPSELITHCTETFIAK